MGGQSIDPLQVVGNVATGGLLGAGESLAQGRPGSALENLGPWGAAVHPINPQIADMGNAIGAGAGIGGGLASGGTGAFNPAVGFGAEAPGAVPYYAGAASGLDLGPGAMIGVDDAGNPIYQTATAAGKGGMTGAEAAGAGIPSMISAGTPGAAAGGGAAGPLTGAALTQQVLGMLGGGSPLSMPQGGAFPGGQPGQLTPQQIAALSAMQDEAHRGLAPGFEQRMSGKPQTPGMAGTNFTA